MEEVFFRLLVVLCLLPITQASVVPPDGSQTSSCNSCCQGPAGQHGIPGVGGSPGNNGLPGRDGMKGEAGSKGDTGEVGMGIDGPRGPEGPSGERGERGSPGLQGVAGKVGPAGLQGIAGRDGNTGANGEPGLKGNKGEMGESRDQRSAFSVAKTNSQTGNVNDVLTFQHVETNIGEDFSLASNKYTCQIPGTYVFMFTITTHSYQQDPYVDLVKDGATIARAAVRVAAAGVSILLQCSQSMVVQLAVGNAVWLKFANSGKQVVSDDRKYTTFSGFLLYED